MDEPPARLLPEQADDPFFFLAAWLSEPVVAAAGAHGWHRGVEDLARLGLVTRNAVVLKASGREGARSRRWRGLFFFILLTNDHFRLLYTGIQP